MSDNKGLLKNLGTPTIIKKQGLLNNSELYKNMNEGYSQYQKHKSKAKHEFRTLSKEMERHNAASKAGQHDVALKYSNRIINRATEGGDRNPKIAKLKASMTTEGIIRAAIGALSNVRDKAATKYRERNQAEIDRMGGQPSKDNMEAVVKSLKGMKK